MGCAPSTPCLSRMKIKPEQESSPQKQEGEKNEEQSSSDSLQKRFSEDDKGVEVEPPSQPRKAWPQLSGRKQQTQPEHELVHQNPSRAHTCRSSELGDQIQSDQLHEQVLPNQPHLCGLSELEDQNQSEETEKGSQKQPHEWKSKEQVGQNLPAEEAHERGSTAQPYACQPSAPDIQNKTEHVHKQVPHSNESSALENQKQPVRVNEQDSPVQSQTLGTSNELEKNSQPEHIIKKESVFQSHKGHSSEQENENQTDQPEQAPEKLPIKELENQSEEVRTQQQRAFQSVKQVNPNQTEQTHKQLPPILNPSNTWQKSESKSQLEHVNEQKPLTQPSTCQSGELEKQNEPQQTHEHGVVTQPNARLSGEQEKQNEPEQTLESGAVTQPHTRQSRDGLEIQSESEPEQANQTEPPRQEGISIPKHWAPMPRTDTTVQMVKLLPGSSEYQMVINQVQATHDKLSIQTIERVQNPGLYQSYMLRKQKMDHDNKGTDNERRLFHGANHRSMQAIKTNGYNRDSCGVQKKAYGRGLYFTKDAFYSVGYAGGSGGDAVRYLYLARVLVGQYCQGNASMILPPSKQPSVPETLYESVVDNTSDPSIFVVFYGTQCYPEYLITLERVDS